MSCRVLAVFSTGLILLVARALPAQAPQAPPSQAGRTFDGQAGPPQYGSQPGQAGQGHPFAGPTQPVIAGPAAGQRVIRPPVMRHAPFQLTKEEFANLMAVLSAWEKKSSQVDLLRCHMEILEYDLTFPIHVPPAAAGQTQQVKPNHVWHGELKYQAPDKGWFEAQTENGAQQQKWIVDGKSVFQFNYQARKVIQRDLPPELQGTGIGDGPLPFFFGAKAERLARRYFMRILTPAHLQAHQIWLEAYPRFQFDAANFRRATIILDIRTTMPVAVEIYSPSGNERSVYKFSGTQIGRNLLEQIFQQDIFRVDPPPGWQRVVNPGANNPRAASAKGPRTRR